MKLTLAGDDNLTCGLTFVALAKDKCRK